MSGSETESRPEDESFLEACLGGADLPVPPQALRSAVLERTSRVVMSRARRRRLAAPLGAATTFALGFVMAWSVRPSQDAPLPVAPRQETRVEQPMVHTLPQEDQVAERSDAAPRLQPQDPAGILEKVWGAPPAERPELLRLAGDSYLARGGDLTRALDCYRQVLEISSGSSMTLPDPDDSWLLEALKLSRQIHSRR